MSRLRDFTSRDSVCAEKRTEVVSSEVYGTHEDAVAIRFVHWETGDASSAAILGLKSEDALTLAVQLIEAVRSQA